MRHFLSSANAVGMLPGGVPACPMQRPLVACPRSPERLPTPDRPALPAAIDLSVIAPSANPNLPMATCAVEEPVAALDRQRPAAPPTGHVLAIRACSTVSSGALRSPIAMTYEARVDPISPGPQLLCSGGTLLHRTLYQWQLGKD